MSQNLSSTVFVIGTLKVKVVYGINHNLRGIACMQYCFICFHVAWLKLSAFVRILLVGLSHA